MEVRVAVCVQIKKILPEFSWAMLAGGHGYRFNWLESQVLTMNFCNSLFLRNKFNWLKPIAQANEAVFSISQTSGVGYRKCASSAMLSGCANRGMPAYLKLVVGREKVNWRMCKWRYFCLKFHEPCLPADMDFVLIDWNWLIKRLEQCFPSRRPVVSATESVLHQRCFPAVQVEECLCNGSCCWGGWEWNDVWANEESFAWNSTNHACWWRWIQL